MGNNAYWNVHVAWREMVISMPLRERNDKTFSIVLKNIESMSFITIIKKSSRIKARNVQFLPGKIQKKQKIHHFDDDRVVVIGGGASSQVDYFPNSIIQYV